MRIQWYLEAENEARARMESARAELSVVNLELEKAKEELVSQRKALSEVKGNRSQEENALGNASASLESVSRHRADIYESLAISVWKGMKALREAEERYELLESEISVLNGIKSAFEGMSADIAMAKSELISTEAERNRREKQLEIMENGIARRISELEAKEKLVAEQSEMARSWNAANQKREKALDLLEKRLNDLKTDQRKNGKNTAKHAVRAA